MANWKDVLITAAAIARTHAERERAEATRYRLQRRDAGNERVHRERAEALNSLALDLAHLASSQGSLEATVDALEGLAKPAAIAWARAYAETGSAARAADAENHVIEQTHDLLARIDESAE